MTWLEFETDSGRIVCVVNSGGTPSVMDGHAVIPAPEEWDGDILGWAVKDGVLTRIRSTELEQLEAERKRRGQQGRVKRRIKGLMNEFIFALLDEDEDRGTRLKAEFRRLKALL